MPRRNCSPDFLRLRHQPTKWDYYCISDLHIAAPDYMYRVFLLHHITVSAFNVARFDRRYGLLYTYRSSAKQYAVLSLSRDRPIVLKFPTSDVAIGLLFFLVQRIF